MFSNSTETGGHHKNGGSNNGLLSKIRLCQCRKVLKNIGQLQLTVPELFLISIRKATSQSRLARIQYPEEKVHMASRFRLDFL